MFIVEICRHHKNTVLEIERQFRARSLVFERLRVIERDQLRGVVNFSYKAREKIKSENAGAFDIDKAVQFCHIDCSDSLLVEFNPLQTQRWKRGE